MYMGEIIEAVPTANPPINLKTINTGWILLEAVPALSLGCA
jgi:hypothetical protein